MKTQINNLRTGVKNQFLNANIDYTKLPQSSTHNGHAGSNRNEVSEVWKKVTSENKEFIRVKILDLELTLKSNWSVSGLSVKYFSYISQNDLVSNFNMTPSKKETAYISIQDANTIIVSNGKNNFKHICPSLVEII